MLVREVTQDKEGLTDPGVHHLRYAYLPHAGTAQDAQPWLAAYEFNQPLIVAWKTEQRLNVQLPFVEETKARALESLDRSVPLPLTFSLGSAQNAVIADLYRQGDQIEAVVLNYTPMASVSIQVGGRTLRLPQSMFTLITVPAVSSEVPP